MFFSQIIFALFFLIICFIMGMGMVVYPKITMWIKKKPLEKTDEIPSITILIPAYNEEKIIGKKIENTLSLNYPKDKMEIVVIDNGDDNTFNEAKKFPVTVLKSERGKIKAMNKGLEYAKTDVIIFTDADTELGKDSIRSMVSYLTGKVGLVNGYAVPEENQEIKSKAFLKEKRNYKTNEWKLRYEEGLIDSICNAEGRLMALRKSIVSKIPETFITDDYALTFLIRGKGYRLVADPKATVSEELPATLKEELRQFKRYSLDIFVTNFRNTKFLFNPKYGYFGMMTFPFRRFFPLFYPLFLVYILAYAFFIHPLIALAFFILGAIVLAFKRLMLIQLIAVASAYFRVLSVKTLTGGKWQKSR